MDQTNRGNINDHSTSIAAKSDEKMDSHTYLLPSRKRKSSHSFDTSSAKRSFTGSDLCDESASSSYTTCAKNFIPASLVAHHAPVRTNNEVFNEVYKNYNDIKKHISEKHPIFSIHSIINVMNNANVTSGKRILVYDEMGGMVTVSALKLIKGNGEMWFLYEKFSSQSCPAFKAIDYNDTTSKELNTFRLIRLSSIANILPSAVIQNSNKMNAAIDDESMDCEDSTITVRPRRLEYVPEKIDILPRFDTMIILSNMISPVSFLENFFDFLLPSASIAIFTHSEEEAQMVQAYLVAANAKDINISSMATFYNHSEETTQEMGHFISAIKSA